MRADGGAAAADGFGEEFDARPPRTPAAGGATGAPELRLGAWEGPLDLLLELARAGKVDLSRLSILDLAGQFGAALEAAAARRRVPLARLADWLVMAAHLALLRSRLLLPADSTEGGEAQREAGALRRRLAEREHARRLTDWLERRPRLGRDVFARGAAAEEPHGGDRAAPVADTAALFRACLAALEKDAGHGTYRPEPPLLWRVPDALARMRRMLPAIPEGAPLERFLPETADDESPEAALRRRAALASTLLAGLELEREGSAALAQDAAFAPVSAAPRPPRGSVPPRGERRTG